MPSEYIAYTFKVTPVQPALDILIAELDYIGFDSFLEKDDGLVAYIETDQWNDRVLDDVYVLNSGEFSISYTYENVKQVNWNTEWEKNFDPIVVDDICTIRAPFHKLKPTTYDILIAPKMSFGTGHHETTYMMIQHILENDFNQKSVLDMGCGTGVLAILSEKRGAKYIDAIDYDNWCYINSLENIALNDCNCINVIEGDAQIISNHYDIILANINRNILLKDIATYASFLNTSGKLFLSGFYKEDIPIIEKECSKNNLRLNSFLEHNNWVALEFIN